MPVSLKTIPGTITTVSQQQKQQPSTNFQSTTTTTTFNNRNSEKMKTSGVKNRGNSDCSTNSIFDTSTIGVVVCQYDNSNKKIHSTTTTITSSKMLGSFDSSLSSSPSPTPPPSTTTVKLCSKKIQHLVGMFDSKDQPQTTPTVSLSSSSLTPTRTPSLSSTTSTSSSSSSTSSPTPTTRLNYENLIDTTTINPTKTVKVTNATTKKNHFLNEFNVERIIVTNISNQNNNNAKAIANKLATSQFFLNNNNNNSKIKKSDQQQQTVIIEETKCNSNNIKNLDGTINDSGSSNNRKINVIAAAFANPNNVLVGDGDDNNHNNGGYDSTKINPVLYSSNQNSINDNHHHNNNFQNSTFNNNSGNHIECNGIITTNNDGNDDNLKVERISNTNNNNNNNNSNDYDSQSNQGDDEETESNDEQQNEHSRPSIPRKPSYLKRKPLNQKSTSPSTISTTNHRRYSAPTSIETKSLPNQQSSFLHRQQQQPNYHPTLKQIHSLNNTRQRNNFFFGTNYPEDEEEGDEENSENQKIEVKLRDKKLLQKQQRLPSGDLERPFGIVEVVQPEEIDENLNLTNSSDFFQDFRPSQVSESSTRNSGEFSQEEPEKSEFYHWNPKLESLKKQQDKSDSLDSQQAQACCTKLAFNIYNKAVEGAKKHLPKNKQKNRYSGAFPRSFGEDFHSLGPEGFYYLDDAQTECSLDYRDIEFNRDSYLINGAEVLPELSEDEFYQNNPRKPLQASGELTSTEPKILDDIKKQRKQSNEMDPPRIPENTPMGSVENFSFDGNDLKPELKRKAPSLFEKLFKKNKPKHDNGDGKSSKARSEPREVEREKNFRAQSLPPASINKHNQRQQPPVPPPTFKISEDGKLWFEHKTIPPPMNPDEAYVSNVTRQSPIKLVYGKPPEIIVQEVTNLSEAVDTLPRSSTPASINDVAEKTMIDILDDAIRQLREESNIPIYSNENQPPETSQLYDDNKSKNNPNKRKPNSFKLKKPKFLKKFEKKPTPDRDEMKFETTPDTENMPETPTMPEITIEEVKDTELDLDANIPQFDEIDSNMERIQPPNKPGRNRFAMKKPKIFEKKLPRPGQLKIRSKNKDNSNNPKSPYMKKLNGKIPSWKDTSKKLFPLKSKPYKDESPSRLSDIPESPDSPNSNFNRRADDPIAIEIEVGIPLDAPYDEFEEQQQSPSKGWTSSPFHRYPDQQQQSPSIVQENIQQKSPTISIPKPEIIVLPETPEETGPEKEPDFTTTSNYRYKPPEIIVKIPLNAKSDYDTDYNTPDMIIQSPPQSPKFSHPEPSFSGITMPEPEFIMPTHQEKEIVHTKQQEVDLQPKQFEPIENIKEIGITYEPPELMYGEEPSDGIVKPMKDKVEKIKNMAGSFGQSFKTKMKDLIQKKPVVNNTISEPKVVDVTLKSSVDPSADLKETDLDEINNCHPELRDDQMMMNNQFNEPIQPYDGDHFNFNNKQQPKPPPTRIWDVPVSDYHVDITVDDEEPPDNRREKKKSNRKFRLKMPNLSGDERQVSKPRYDSPSHEQDTARDKPTFSQKNRERLQQIQHQARKSFGQISDRFKQQKQIIQERTRSFKSKSPTPPPRPPAPQYRQHQYDPYNYDLHFASDSELSPGTGVDSLRRSKVFQELVDTHQRLEMYMSPVDRHEPRRPPRRKTSGPIRDAANDKMFNRSMPSLGHAMRPRVKPPRPPPPCTNKLAATSCQSVPLQISIIPCEDEIPLGTSTSSIWTNGSKPRQRFPRQQRVPPEMFYRNVRLGYRPKKSYVELLQKSQPFYNMAAQQTIERSQSAGQLYGARHTSPPLRRNKRQFPVAPMRKSRTLYVKTKIDPKQHPNWIGLGTKPPMSPPLVGSRATSVASSRHPTMYNDYNPYTTEDEYESTNLDPILFEKFDFKNAQPFYRLPPQSTMTLKSVTDLNWEPYTWKVKRCRSFTELEVRERLRKQQQLRNQQQEATLDEEPSTPDSTDTIVAKQSSQTLRSERAQSTQPHRSYNKSSNQPQIRTGNESMPKRIMQWLSSTKSLDTWQNRNKTHQNDVRQKSAVPPPRPPLPPPRMGGISRATSPTLTTNNSSNSMFYVSNNSLPNKNFTKHKNDLNNYYYYNQNVDNFFTDEQRENGNKTPTNRPLPPPPVPPRPRLIPAHYALKRRPQTRDVACDTSENGFLKFCEQQSSTTNNYNQSSLPHSQLVNGIDDRDRKSVSLENDDELTLVEEKHFSNNNNNNQLVNGNSFKFNNYQDDNVDTSIASVYTDARSHQTNTFSNQNQQKPLQQPNSNGNNNLLSRQWSSDEDTINDDLSSLSSSHYQSVLESPTGTLLQQQQQHPQQSQTQKNDSFLHRYSSLINQQQQQPTIMSAVSKTSTTTTNNEDDYDDNKKILPTNDLQQNQIMPSSPHQQSQTTTNDISEQQQQFMQQYTSERSSIVSEEEEEQQQQFNNDVGDNSHDNIHLYQQEQQDLDKILMKQFSQTTGGNDGGVEDDDDATETSSIKQSSEDQPIRNNKDKKNRQSCISTESSESTTSSTSTSSTISSSSNTFSYSLEPINISNNKNSSSSSTLASTNSIVNKESLLNEEIITSSIASITESETTSSLSSSLSSIISNNNKKKNKKTTQKKFSLTEPPIEISRPRTNTDIQLFQSGSSPNNHNQPSLRENLSSLPKSTPNGSKPDKRYYCAYELYTTERDYVDVLVMLTEEFKNAIKSYVTPKWLETFFKPLDAVTPINKKLLEELQKRVTEEWDDNPKLSDLIIEICPYFKEYSIYIREFDRINFMLDDASQRFDDFEKVLREFENGDRCRKLTVKSYLLKPIQRLPQYRLMLQQYSKCLNEENDVEYEATQRAMKIVSDVVEHIERESLMAERSLTLNELRNCIITTKPIKIVIPGRVLIRRGQLDKVSRKEVHVRYFILFNDVLFYLTPVMNGMYKLKEELPLLGMQVEKSPNFNQEFIVRSVKRSFALLTKDTQEREEWVKDLRDAIADHTEKQQSFNKNRHSTTSIPDHTQIHSIHDTESLSSSPQTTLRRPSDHLRTLSVISTESNEHFSSLEPSSLSYQSVNTFKLGDLAPVWLHDNRVTFCYSCKSQFTFLNRRHHCRACGQIFCADCSSNQFPLKYLDYKPDRVCDDCYEKLSSQQNQQSISQSASNSPPTTQRTTTSLFDRDSCVETQDLTPNPGSQDQENENIDFNHNHNNESGQKSPPKIMVQQDSPQNSIKSGNGDNNSSSNVFSYSSFFKKNRSNSFHDLRHDQVKITPVVDANNFNAVSGGVGQQSQPQQLTTLMRNNNIRLSSRMMNKQKHVSSVLVEVSATDPQALISGWLQKYVQKKGWKRYWFVIKNMVLYTFKASEDVRALETNPLPGYEVLVSDESIKGYPANLIIKLKHHCQSTQYFYAETPEDFKRWFECFKESALLTK